MSPLPLSSATVTGKYFKLKARLVIASLAAIVLLPGGAGTQGANNNAAATLRELIAAGVA